MYNISYTYYKLKKGELGKSKLPVILEPEEAQKLLKQPNSIFAKSRADLLL